MNDQPPTPKRGAQPGNTNALKHGYYASSLHLRTLTRLANVPVVQHFLVEQFLAHFLGRLEDQFGDTFVTLKPAERQLRIATLALYTLTHLLTEQGAISGKVNSAVENALAAVLAQLPQRQGMNEEAAMREDAAVPEDASME